jgi:hypothetical protein
MSRRKGRFNGFLSDTSVCAYDQYIHFVCFLTGFYAGD